MLCAYAERKWAGRRSNPRLLVFSQALYRLSYRPKFSGKYTKKPGVAVTPGYEFPVEVATKCHKRKGYAGSVFAG